ncbi:hypothetical protein [Thiolinea disciformis]|nr:hypothetical protein [Thiolinea disciformis]
MFENITTRYDMSSATWEVAIILLGAFLLGFLFCYVQIKPHKDHDTESNN